MKKILVPCDFSKPAVNAFRFALDLAALSKGTVDLIHVIELPIMNDSVLMPVLNFEKELLKELRAKSQEKFDALQAKYKKTGVAVNTSVMFGAPAMVITRQIQKSRADLVVMGTHGTTGIREVLIGSNAEKIVRQSPSPVLVLKNYSKPKIKNIVLPVVPETESQTDFIDRIKSLQAFFKAKLHIVRINTPVNFTTDTLTRAQLGDFANENKIKNYTLNIFNHLNAASGILEFSQFIDADLIAMGTHGRRGLAHLFNGSNAEDIVNHADRMIWTYNLRKK